MLSALLIALREGVEAALVVGIVLVYLDRTGRRALRSSVVAGLALAVAASLGGAILLERIAVSQEGLEGLLMLLAAVLVVTMIVWMNRVSRTLRHSIEARVEELAGARAAGARIGVLVFVFLMVVREGVELALMLRAVALTSEGLAVWLGAFLGIGAAVAVGVLFFRGTLRIPLGRFFSATSLILGIVALQLALTGVHELSEAMWIPSSRRAMAILGPIVRNDIFFFVLILGTAGILAMREWARAGGAAAAAAVGIPAASPGAAEGRRLRWEHRAHRRWLFAAALALFGTVLALTADHIYARASAPAAVVTPLTAEGGSVRIPAIDLADGRLHHYSVDLGGEAIRFLAIRKPGGGYGTALDACQICGPAGYHQEGPNVICRNCGAAIYIPSIGAAGGCNPIGVPSRIEDARVVIDLSDLARAAGNVARSNTRTGS